MGIDYNRWWHLKDETLGEELKGYIKMIEEDYLVYSGTTSQLHVSKLSNGSVNSIVNEILEQQGSWSIIYYNQKLKKLFIGRDVFGRQSLVFNFESMIFGCRTKPETSGKWIEIPFGQVTVFSLDSTDPVIYSYLDEYPEVCAILYEVPPVENLPEYSFLKNRKFSDELLKFGKFSEFVKC